MKVFELIQFEKGGDNLPCNEKRVGIFDSTKSIINYLTDNGKSHSTLSMLNCRDDEQKYMEQYLEDSVNLTLARHWDADDNPLLGWSGPACDEYYYVRMLEVKMY